MPGPRPPEFPDFEVDNLAVKLDGKGAHFSFADPGDHSPYQFTNGDAITLEAWVNMSEINPGENVYVIGKGRTEDPGFARDNQNWALRIREVDGKAGSASCSRPHRSRTRRRTATGTAGPARRASPQVAAGITWRSATSSANLTACPRTGSTARRPAACGTWAASAGEPPIVDNDAIWIGSSLGGRAANSFRGLLDEVAIHRGTPAHQARSSRRTRYRRHGAWERRSRRP